MPVVVQQADPRCPVGAADRGVMTDADLRPLGADRRPLAEHPGPGQARLDGDGPGEGFEEGGESSPLTITEQTSPERSAAGIRRRRRPGPSSPEVPDRPGRTTQRVRGTTSGSGTRAREATPVQLTTKAGIGSGSAGSAIRVRVPRALSSRRVSPRRYGTGATTGTSARSGSGSDPSTRSSRPGRTRTPEVPG